MNAQYPMAPMAKALEQYGRYGDTQLVHLNPIEVEMLRSMSPTGELTTNPVTGQPEAFLPLLAPVLGMVGGGLGLSALGTGLLTGAATAAITGDIKRGLLAGVTGGLASGLGEGLASLAQDAAVDAATTGVDFAAQAAQSADLANTALTGAGMAPLEAAAQGATELTTQFGTDFLGQAAQSADLVNNALTGAGVAPIEAATQGATELTAQVGTDFAGQAAQSADAVNQAIATSADKPAWYMADSEFTQGLKDIPDTMKLYGVGQGVTSLSAMDYADEQERLAREAERDKKRRYEESLRGMQTAIRTVNPGYQGFGMQAGGQVPNPLLADILNRASQGEMLTPVEQAMFEEYYANQQAGVRSNLAAEAEQEAADRVAQYSNISGLSAVNQLGAAGQLSRDDVNWFNKWSKEAGDNFSWMTDPNADWDKFYSETGLNKENVGRVQRVQSAIESAMGDNTLRSVGDQDLAQMQFDAGMAGLGKGGAYGSNILMGNPAMNAAGQRDLRGGQFNVSDLIPRDYKAGFEPEVSYFQDSRENVVVPSRQYRPTRQLIAPTGNKPAYETIGMADGGIAAIAPDQRVDTDALALIPAVLGQAENADEIINRFIQKYGVDRFREVRAMILDRYVAPNAQKEGMIRGQGGGMDDQVMGMIGADQPVAVSPGEYIVPADVVSGLGDGSSDAGAKELDGMMDRVRMARGGNTNQPPPTNAQGLLPA